jgi:hypothetical protein
MPMSCFEAQEALVTLLNRLSREWIEFDTSNPTENTPLYLLCSTGMLEMHVSGRAWGSSTALDFEAWLVGLWIDATRRSILPDELRRAVPAWAGQAVAVQLAPRMRVRLTLDGKAAQDVVRQQGSAGFLEYICSRPVPGRVRVRILGNQGPAPGAVHSDPLTVALTNWAEGAEAFAKVLMPSQQAVAQQAREQPEAVPQQPVQKDATPQTNPAAELDYWSPEPVKDARHSPDFRSVYWFGQEYSFTANQAACVRLLWEAWENGTPELSGPKILEEADIDQDRLSAVFRDHPAWKTMIRPGHTKGAYRLSPPTAHRKAPKNHG